MALRMAKILHDPTADIQAIATLDFIIAMCNVVVFEHEAKEKIVEAEEATMKAYIATGNQPYDTLQKTMDQLQAFRNTAKWFLEQKERAELIALLQFFTNRDLSKVEEFSSPGDHSSCDCCRYSWKWKPYIHDDPRRNIGNHFDYQHIAQVVAEVLPTIKIQA